MVQTKSVAKFTFFIFLLIRVSIGLSNTLPKHPYSINKKQPQKKSTISKEFKLKDFDRLKIGSAFTINVYYGDAYVVKVSGKSEHVDDVEAEVKGGELLVTFKDNKTRLRIKEVVTVDITMPALRAVEFSGTSSSVVFPGFKTSNFVAYVSGTAYSEINMKSKEVFLDAAGACTLKLIGQSEQLKVNANGTAVVDALNMQVNDATLDVSGTSNTKVNVGNSIKASAGGASSIRYKGEAKLLSVDTSRLSSIKKIQ